MHRSGTSFIASWLQASGLFIGDRLAGATASNVKGHFEDIDFLELHERMLHDNGVTMYLDESRPLAVSEERWQEASAFIEQRNACYELWGFKQPRATLFLDTWHEWLPAAKYLIVLRHPASIVNSILRRESNKCILRNDEVTGPQLQAAYLAEADQHAKRYDAMHALHLRCVLDQLEKGRGDHYFIFDFNQRVSEAERLQKQLYEWGMDLNLISIHSLFDKKLLIEKQEYIFNQDQISEESLGYYDALKEYVKR